MDHVLIHKLEHLTGSARRPALDFAIEMRERPGPAYKTGAFPGDVVWIQLHGGLFVAKAHIRLGWVGEYSEIKEIRARTRGAAIHEIIPFWKGRARFGYAALASLEHESWIEPFWAGPRTYAYEWVLLENDKKRSSWLERKDAPRSGDTLRAGFEAWKTAH